MKLFGSLSELVRVIFRKDTRNIEVRPNQSTTYTADRNFDLPPGDSSQVLMSASSSQTVTNKSIDADTNTITNIDDNEIKAAAAISATKIADGSVDNTEFQRLGTAGTAGAGNLVSTDGTQTLTNKTIDADTNTITNIENADIKSGAAIDATKVADGSVDNTEFQRLGTAGTAGAGNLLTTDGTQTLTNKTINGSSNTLTVLAGTQLSGQTPIGNGGTGQSTANAGFNALAPTTTKGDLIAFSTINDRLPVGTDGQILTADSTQTLGVKWAANSAGQDSILDLNNLSIACSVGSNALTIALKDKAGSDPSGSSPVVIGFRNATSTTGTYNVRSVTAATSLVVSSGSTLGTRSTEADFLYVYALDNSGTVELGVSRTLFDDGTIRSTTAEGGAGAADSNRLIYSTTARTNVPVRLIARLKSTQTTAGTWAAVPTEISVGNFQRDLPNCSVIMTSSQSIPGTSTDTKITNFSVLQWDNMGGYDTSLARYTIPVTGVYRIDLGINFDAAAGAFAAKVLVNGSTEAVRNYMEIGSGMGGVKLPIHATGTITLTAGDYVEPFANHATGGNRNISTGAGIQIPTFTIQMISLT